MCLIRNPKIGRVLNDRWPRFLIDEVCSESIVSGSIITELIIEKITRILERNKRCGMTRVSAMDVSWLDEFAMALRT